MDFGSIDLRFDVPVILFACSQDHVVDGHPSSSSPVILFRCIVGVFER